MTFPGIERTDLLCTCTEPHWHTGGACGGPALDVATARTSALARMEAARRELIGMDDETGGSDRVYRAHAVGEADLALCIGVLRGLIEGNGDATTDVAYPPDRPTDDQLQNLLERRDLAGLVDAMAERLRICSCADGHDCDHQPTGGTK